MAVSEDPDLAVRQELYEADVAEKGIELAFAARCARRRIARPGMQHAAQYAERGCSVYTVCCTGHAGGTCPGKSFVYRIMRAWVV